MATKKSRKRDRYLISKQPWEIRFVRVIFYVMSGEAINHPTKETVLSLIKQFNNSRLKVYKALEAAGYTNVTKK